MEVNYLSSTSIASSSNPHLLNCLLLPHHQYPHFWMKLKFKVTHFLLTDKLLFGIKTAVKGKVLRIALSYSHCIPVTRLRACGMMHSGPYSELQGFAAF